MNLCFVNPALLCGLLAAAIPIAIHLFFRRRVAEVLGALVAAVRGGARLASHPEPNGQPVGQPPPMARAAAATSSS